MLPNTLCKRSSAGPTCSAWRSIAGLSAIAGFLAMAWAITGAPAGRAAPPAPRNGGVAGQLLVATPELNDPRFIHTVIYMLQHDAGGAMGLVVNRPFKEVPIATLLDHLGLESAGVRGTIRMHYGGPVEPDRSVVLHTADYATEGTQAIGGGIALTGHPAILRAIAAGTGPRRALLAFGYAGWAPGQLEGEIQAGAWAVVPADAALVFDDKYETKWDRAMVRRKIDL